MILEMTVGPTVTKEPTPDELAEQDRRAWNFRLKQSMFDGSQNNVIAERGRAIRRELAERKRQFERRRDQGVG